MAIYKWDDLLEQLVLISGNDDAQQEQKKLLYFAYGSNLNLKQFDRRVWGYEKVCNYTLRNYKLVFDTGNRKDRSFANIIPCKRQQVEGVIFKIDSNGEHSLDLYEGVNQGLYKKSYFQYNNELVLWYEGVAKNNHYPSQEYLLTILKGCYDNQLVTTAEKIKNLLKKLYNYERELFTRRW